MGNVLMYELSKIDLRSAELEIASFIRESVRASGAEGVVVGLSGGVDSSVATALCVKYLGADQVLSLIMPTYFTPRGDLEDAEVLADELGVEHRTIGIDAICDRVYESVGADPSNPAHRIPMANVRARARMVLLYYFANSENRLVVGTGDRSEILLGYFTKYGDGGADLLPIAHLYKTQVRMMAVHLGLPSRIAEKEASPQLYPGHRAIDELPLGYDRLDPILYGLFDRKLRPEEVAELSETPLEIVREVLRRHSASHHKRRTPPTVRPVD
ncbi:MAG: NAD+ synthase [Candidatus Bathyarchaeia archaeon]